MALRAKGLPVIRRLTQASEPTSDLARNNSEEGKINRERHEQNTTLESLEMYRSLQPNSIKPPQVPPSNPVTQIGLQSPFWQGPPAAAPGANLEEAVIPSRDPPRSSAQGPTSIAPRVDILTSGDYRFPDMHLMQHGQPELDIFAQGSSSTQGYQLNITDVRKGLSGQKSLTSTGISVASLTTEGRRQAQAAGDKLRARTSSSRHRRVLMTANDHANSRNRWAEYNTPDSVILPKFPTASQQNFGGPSLTAEGRRQAQVAGDKLRLRTNPIRHSRPRHASVTDHGINKNRWSSYAGVRVTRTDERHDENSKDMRSSQHEIEPVQPANQPSLLEVFEAELAKRIVPEDSPDISAADTVADAEGKQGCATQATARLGTSNLEASSKQGNSSRHDLSPLLEGLKAINGHLSGLATRHEGPSQDTFDALGNGVRTVFGSINSFLQTMSGGMQMASKLTRQAADHTVGLDGGLIEDAAVQFAHIEKGVAALADEVNSIHGKENASDPNCTDSDFPEFGPAPMGNTPNGQVLGRQAGRSQSLNTSICATSTTGVPNPSTTASLGRFEVPDGSDDEDDEDEDAGAFSDAPITDVPDTSFGNMGHSDIPLIAVPIPSFAAALPLKSQAPNTIVEETASSIAQRDLQDLTDLQDERDARKATVHPIEEEQRTSYGRASTLQPVATRFPTLAQFEGQSFVPETPFPSLPSMSMEPLIPERVTPQPAPKTLEGSHDATQIAKRRFATEELLEFNGINPMNLSDSLFEAFQRQSPVVQQQSIQIYAQHLAKNQSLQRASSKDETKQSTRDNGSENHDIGSSPVSSFGPNNPAGCDSQSKPKSFQDTSATKCKARQEFDGVHGWEKESSPGNCGELDQSEQVEVSALKSHVTNAVQDDMPKSQVGEQQKGQARNVPRSGLWLKSSQSDFDDGYRQALDYEGQDNYAATEYQLQLLLEDAQSKGDHLYGNDEDSSQPAVRQVPGTRRLAPAAQILRPQDSNPEWHMMPHKPEVRQKIDDEATRECHTEQPGMTNQSFLRPQQQYVDIAMPQHVAPNQDLQRANIQRQRILREQELGRIRLMHEQVHQQGKQQQALQRRQILKLQRVMQQQQAIREEESMQQGLREPQMSRQQAQVQRIRRQHLQKDFGHDFQAKPDQSQQPIDLFETQNRAQGIKFVRASDSERNCYDGSISENEDWNEDEDEPKEPRAASPVSDSATARIISFVDEGLASEGMLRHANGFGKAFPAPGTVRESAKPLPSAARLAEPFDPLDEMPTRSNDGIRRNVTVSGTDSRYNARTRRPYSQAFDGKGRVGWDSFLKDDHHTPRNIPIRGPSSNVTKSSITVNRERSSKGTFGHNEQDRKITDCVRQLKDLGFLKAEQGGHERLSMYAQASGGDLVEAIDMIDEEERAYRERL